MAVRVRRSQLPAPPKNWTMLDLHYNHPQVFFRQFLNSSSGKAGWPTLLDRFISEPTSIIALSEDLGSVPLTTAELYSVRMSQLLNSFFTVMNGVYTIAGGFSNATAYWNESSSFIPPINSKESPIYNPDEILWYHYAPPAEPKGMVWSTEGTKGVSTEVLKAHKPWVIVLCIASLVLIFASLVSPLVHFFLIRGPEVMMNISSLATRHNSSHEGIYTR